MTISIVAIDGVGQDTDKYLQLLRGCHGALPSGRPKLLTSDRTAAADDVECVVIQPLDYFGYSRFCVEELHSYIDTDFALTVQLDGYIVNPNLFSQDFLAYDYVGAPWRSTRKRPLQAGREVGNGGFSLRSQKFLKAASELRWHKEWQHIDVPTKYHGNEDYFLCVVKHDEMVEKGVRYAPVPIAKRFSIQAGDQLSRGHNLHTTFGFHGKKWVARARRAAARHGLHYKHVDAMELPWWQRLL